MRKNILFVTLVAIAMVLPSCDSFFGIDLTNQKAIDNNLPSKIEKVAGPNAKIVEIALIIGGSGSNFSKVATMADVYFFNASGELKRYDIDLSNDKAKESSSLFSYIDDDTDLPKVKPEDYPELSKVDFSKIASNIEKAGKMVENHEDEFSGVGRYTMLLNADPLKALHKFTIQSRQGSNTSSKSGGGLQVTVNYTESEFQANPEGNVTEINE